MILTDIPFSLDRAALFQSLHMDPSSADAPEILAVAEQAAALARPKALYKVAYIEARGEDTVTVDGITFTSHVLSANLADVQRVFAYVATCGVEMDSTPVPAGDLLGDYVLDVVKTMALRAATAHIRAHLEQTYDLKRVTAMHPGSGDKNVWPIQQQRPLFNLIGDVEAQIGVRLTKSLLMQPNKTVSGILYPAEVDFHTCRLCHREDCPGRQSPFDPDLWEERMSDAADA